MKYAFNNGKIKEFKDIRISPYDLGFLRGYATFDVSRTTKNGKVFLLDEHYKRIKKSSKSIGLDFDLTKEEFNNVIKKLLKKNKVKEATIRTIISGGESKSKFSFEGNENTLILMEDLIMNSEKNFKNGVGVVTLKYNRELPEIKTINYLHSIKNQNNQKKLKAFETVYINNNTLFEASTANIFVVKKEKIFTPKDGILPGITRNLVIKLAKKNNIKIFEKKISQKEFLSADEVFLTATNKNILPVVKVDRKKIADGKVGDVTKKFIDIFNKFEENY